MQRRVFSLLLSFLRKKRKSEPFAEQKESKSQIAEQKEKNK